MSRKRTKKNASPRKEESSEVSWVTNLRPLTSTVLLGVVLAAAICGLEQLKHYVYAQPEYRPAVKVELADLGEDDWVDREGWRARILDHIVVPQDKAWVEGELLTNVAEQMAQSGWVSNVRRAWKERDGTIRLACDFRRPIAMVQTVDGSYIPVDKYGIRLPEKYDRVSSDLGWMRIIGVEASIPKIGESFVDSESDAMAAVRVATLIFERQEISPWISSVDVTNFKGRRNKRENHIKLWTHDGKRIDWGSAIGEEVEEASAEEKLQSISLLLKTGTLQARADVSIYPASVLVDWDESK